MADEKKPKRVTQSFAFQPEMLAKIRAKADAEHGGNLSRYIQSLIEADLNRGADRAAHEDAKSEVILEHLAYKWRPDVAPAVSSSIPEGFDQRALLGAIIEDLPNFFRVSAENFKRAARQNEESSGFWGAARHEYECRLFPKSNADEVLMCYAALAAQAERPGDKPWAELYAGPLMTPMNHRMAGIMSEGKWNASIQGNSTVQPNPAPAPSPEAKSTAGNTNSGSGHQTNGPASPIIAPVFHAPQPTRRRAVKPGTVRPAALVALSLVSGASWMVVLAANFAKETRLVGATDWVGLGVILVVALLQAIPAIIISIRLADPCFGMPLEGRDR